MGVQMLKVSATRNGQESFYNVSSAKEAFDLINSMADADLKSDTIDYNVFDLLIYDDGVYESWQNSWGEHMEELISDGEYRP
jgi:hypothetical protein